MPAFARKVLWAVNINTASAENRLFAHAQAIAADAVCVRTTSSRFTPVIARFHAAGMKVYGWRWPAVRPTTAAPHYYAIDEANFVAQHLVPQGLDGYIADPESEGPGQLNDWNDQQHRPLARQFCSIIKTAGGAAFAFGVTSGCAFPTSRPNLPWAEFVSASDALFPQTYWRARLGANGAPTSINGGNPNAAIQRGLTSWGPIAQGRPIVPMAGEIDVVTPAELAAYGAKCTQLGSVGRHFYTDLAAVTAARLAAMRNV